MILSAFKNDLLKSLQDTYPQKEIESFFYLLIAFHLKLSRIEIALDRDYKIPSETQLLLEQALLRLTKNEPIQYITQEAFFCGLTFFVNQQVLIPRPETEELVDWIVRDATHTEPKTILDMGTGSGCIAISLAKKLKTSQITAIDISEEALSIAKKNANTHAVSVNFKCLDLLSLKGYPAKFDYIVSNPPYVLNSEKKKMHSNVLDYEPSLALFVSDDDPLLFYCKIIKFAKNHLQQNGSLYLEINQEKGDAILTLLKDNGFQKRVLKKDIYNTDRMIKATLL